MYKEIEIWTAVCDGCGKDINEDSEFSGWNEKKYNDAICEEAGWLVERNEHYCPDCYYYDDEDNVVFVKNLK